MDTCPIGPNVSNATAALAPGTRYPESMMPMLSR